MFEGKPPFAATGNAPADRSNAGDQLHTLSWGDLVAKLEAARDLRIALAKGEGQEDGVVEASFDAHSAHHLAEQQDASPANNEFRVNPLDSGNRKDTSGIEGPNDNAEDRLSRGRK